MSYNAYSQDDRADSIPTIHGYVETMPEFPGNVNAYLARNVRYPKDALEEGISGRVKVLFCVDTSGKVDSVTVAKSVHPSLDAEAVRVVSMMPKWKPGSQNREPVRIYYTLPILFAFDGDPIPPDDKEKTEITEHTKDSLANNSYAEYDGDWAGFIAQNINYPKDARRKGIKKAVKVKFLVEPTGKVSEYTLESLVYPSLDKEALRVAAKMVDHKWIPGKKDGINIRNYLVIPFLFPPY